jgi:hypothetical protein
MLNPKNYKFCAEFYVVEKSIEVVARIKSDEASSRFKIDALNGADHYCIRAYKEEVVKLQLTYPQIAGAFDSKPQNLRIWVEFDLPWVHVSTADQALAEALSFLSERCAE